MDDKYIVPVMVATAIVPVVLGLAMEAVSSGKVGEWIGDLRRRRALRRLRH